MKRKLCIRSVFDARSQSTKHLYQLLLLCASWHRYSRETAPLEIFVVGKPALALCNFLRSLGVAWTLVEPDENDAFSKTSNTIVGAREKDGHRILLVDNDVVFLGDLAELAAADDELCMGAVAGSARLSSAQWQVIEEQFDVKLLPTTQVPLAERVKNQIDPAHAPQPLRNVYVNGGVILVPASADFEQRWRDNVRRIAAAFEQHPLRSKSVYGSNMAALALTIAQHSNFDWLDLKYNFRPDCFALGVGPFSEIQIAHLTGVDDSHSSLGGRVDAFWDEKMVPRFRRARPSLAGTELQEAMGEALQLRAELDQLISAYDLDRWAAALPRHRGHLWKSTWSRYVNRPLFRMYGELLSSASRLRRRLAS